MRTLELLLLGGAALLFLSKKSEAAGVSDGAAGGIGTSLGVFPSGVAPSVITKTAAEVLGANTSQYAGVSTPAQTPKTTEAALGELSKQLQTGADKQAVAWEAKLISQGTPKSAETVKSEIQQGIINTNTGGLNAVWTGVGFFNPYTGVTHVPTVYK